MVFVEPLKYTQCYMIQKQTVTHFMLEIHTQIPQTWGFMTRMTL